MDNINPMPMHWAYWCGAHNRACSASLAFFAILQEKSKCVYSDAAYLTDCNFRLTWCIIMHAICFVKGLMWLLSFVVPTQFAMIKFVNLRWTRAQNKVINDKVLSMELHVKFYKFSLYCRRYKIEILHIMYPNKNLAWGIMQFELQFTIGFMTLRRVAKL